MTCSCEVCRALKTSWRNGKKGAKESNKRIADKKDDMVNQLHPILLKCEEICDNNTWKRWTQLEIENM